MNESYHNRVALVALSMLLLNASPSFTQEALPLHDGIRFVAQDLASKLKEGSKTRVAVLPLRGLDGQETMLGRYVAESMITDLFNSGSFELVERAQLDRLLKEMDFSASGLIDPETAQQFGRVAGVDAIVTGAIVDFNSRVALNCRVIETSTGKLFAAAQVRIIKDQDVISFLNLPVPNSSSAPPKAAKESLPARALREADVVSRWDMSFELKECVASGDTVRCQFLIENNGSVRSLHPRGARLVDREGNDHRAQGFWIGVAPQGQGLRYGSTAYRMVQGVPTRAEVVFSGVSESSQGAALLELDLVVQRTDWGYGAGGNASAGSPVGSTLVAYYDVTLVR